MCPVRLLSQVKALQQPPPVAPKKGLFGRIIKAINNE